MLTMTWKQPPNSEVMALMPAERARVNELIEQGVQETDYLAADQSTAWVVWNCASQDEVQETLRTLPLHEFFDTGISPLADEG
ncbi:MAG: muconolactone Delta-isomerase family protein [Chloroflexota bacterium]